MIGYKLLDKDMKAMLGNGMRYELGKKYIMYEKDVILYKSGYHFYKELEDCINSDVYYNELIQSRFFKVETGEYIKKDMYNNSSKNLVTNDIILLEEIFIKDIIEYCKENRNKINKMMWIHVT